MLAGGAPNRQGSASSAESPHASAHSMGGFGTVGEVQTDPYYDPVAYLTAWNQAPMPGQIPARDGWATGQFYRETRRADGTRLREYQFVAVDREIEIAPGVYFPAWTYNGQVPGPTIRATEGDTIRIRFINQGSHPHTLHFHGWHRYEMDGAFTDQFVAPGGEFIYEFEADPVGLHLYHCHSVPLKRHIHKGLYGVFIVDPDPKRHEERLQPVARSRNPDFAEHREVREFIMTMNAFDTTFDAENEVYAVNTVAFHYMRHPIHVKVGELVRIYLVNITEFDPINSFHLHAGFFDVFRTGTKLETTEYTDTVMLCQAERAIIEFRLRHPGQYMFHAHQSEFAELGWMGVFEASDADSPAINAASGSTGYPAPSFELSDSTGRSVRLADFVGRSHLLMVFSLGAACSHCSEQAQALVRDCAAFRAAGAEVVLVTPDGMDTNGSPVRSLADQGGRVAQVYGAHRVNGGHGSFLIDRGGTVRWSRVGASPFMDHSYILNELKRLNES